MAVRTQAKGSVLAKNKVHSETVPSSAQRMGKVF